MRPPAPAAPPKTAPIPAGQRTARLAVFASGNGSNLQALLDATATGELAAQVGLVVVNHLHAKAIARAQAARVPVCVLPWSPPPGQLAAADSRRAWEQQLCEAVQAAGADLVVLAGWDRLLTGPLLRAYPQKIINLHPALPGALPGLRAIERAHRAFAQGGPAWTGAMVHRVTPEVDAGEVIAFEAIALVAGEPLAELEARVHAVEHRLLVRAVALELAAAGGEGPIRQQW